jgi:hypothetical protein
MSGNHSVKENKNPLNDQSAINRFESFRINIGGKGTIKEEFYHSFMIKAIKVLFRFDNNRRAMLRRSRFEKT